MLLYLVRHGKTELNDSGVIQGTLDHPLSRAGQREAQLAAEHLRLVPFTKGYSSPLKRAAETAQSILSPRPRARAATRLITDDRLAAPSCGAAQGKSWGEVEADYSAERYGGESDKDLDARLRSWLSDLIAEHTPASSSLTSPTSTSTSTSNKKKRDRAALPRPGMARTPTSASMAKNDESGVVLVLTHQECLVGLLRVLTDSNCSPAVPVSAVESASAGGSAGENADGLRVEVTVDEDECKPRPEEDSTKHEGGTSPTAHSGKLAGDGKNASTVTATATATGIPNDLRILLPPPEGLTSSAGPKSPSAQRQSPKSPTSPVRLHVPETLAPAPDPNGYLANTAIALVRIWWEEVENETSTSTSTESSEGGAGQAAGRRMQAVGRLEMWGEHGHLM